MRDKLFRGETPTVKACLIHGHKKAVAFYERLSPDKGFGGVTYGLCPYCANSVDPALSDIIDQEIKERLQGLQGRKARMMEGEWGNAFDTSDMTDQQVESICEITELFQEFANELQLVLPTGGNAGRYRAIAKTKLEECAWAATACVAKTTEF